MQFAFGITAYDSNTEPVDDESYGKIFARYQTWGLDPANMGSTLSDPIPIKRCSSSDLGLEEPDDFDDETEVGGRRWGDVKQTAYEPGFDQEDWYLDLSEDDLDLLGRLKAAQELQGDMEPLEHKMTGPTRFFPTHENSIRDLKYYRKKFWCFDYEKIEETGYQPQRLEVQGDYNSEKARSLKIMFEKCDPETSTVTCKSDE